MAKCPNCDGELKKVDQLRLRHHARDMVQYKCPSCKAVVQVFTRFKKSRKS